MNDPDVSNIAETAVDASTRSRLGEARDAVAFPPEASAALRAEISNYVDELVRETERMAHRGKATHASAHHVRLAQERLAIGLRGRADEAMIAVGGAIFGAGMSAWVSLLTDETFSRIGAGVASVLLVFGASLLAYRFGRR